jgi:hypothetical protein
LLAAALRQNAKDLNHQLWRLLDTLVQRRELHAEKTIIAANLSSTQLWLQLHFSDDQDGERHCDGYDLQHANPSFNSAVSFDRVWL